MCNKNCCYLVFLAFPVHPPEWSIDGKLQPGGAEIWHSLNQESYLDIDFGKLSAILRVFIVGRMNCCQYVVLPIDALL